MAGISVKEFNSAWWSEVYNRIIGAVVFMDDASAECLHWEGGLFNLMNAGAVMVKSLSPFESCPKSCRKAVFITQTTVTQLSTIREVVRHSDLTHCILISCVSLDVVFLELNQGKDVSDVLAAGKAPQEAARMLEDMLYEWIGKAQCLVDVVHTPIFAISLTNVIFTTPPYQSIYPSIDGKLSTSPVSDLYQLSDDERSRIRRVASGLNSMMDSMNLKEEIYFMGAYSSLVAGVLENSPVCLTRKKNCQNPASLIIIDRTLDVCGVTSHCTDSVLDKITAVLPRFPGHGNEAAVDMSPLCQANTINHPVDLQISPGCIYHATDESCVQTYDHMINKSQKEVLLDLYNKLSKIDVEKSPSPKNLLRVTPQSIEKIVNGARGGINHPVDLQISPGCIYHATDESCVQTYDHMINKSQKEVLLDLYNKLSKIDVEKSPSPKNLLRVTPQSIEKIVNGARGNYKIIEQHLGVLQQALAIVQTLKSPRRQLVELMQSLEKQVLQSLTASRDSTSVLYQITQFIIKRRERNMPLENLLALIVHIYSLTGTEVSFSREHEDSLMETLSVAIFEDHKSLFVMEPGQIVTPEEGVAIAKEIMDRLRAISMMRKSMQRYSSVLKPCEIGTGEEYKGLLQQLVEDLVNTDRPELPDLGHRSEGIKDLLLTGFSLLTSKKSRASKHPLDNPLVIIYVIGGLTAEECKRLHRTVITSGVDNTVLFGSTRLVTPVEGMRDVLAL